MSLRTAALAEPKPSPESNFPSLRSRLMETRALSSELAAPLSDEDQVVQAMEIPTRAGLGGETLVIVGSRSETATFPYGFFKDWTLDANVGRFRRN